MTYGPKYFFMSRSRLDPKTQPGTEFSYMCGLSYRAQSRGWKGKKKLFLGNISIRAANWRFSIIFLNGKKIADTFEKNNQKLKAKKS